MQLTEQNYFSNESSMEYISNSQIKSFLECESKALAELKGEYERPKSDALLQGSYLDVILTGNEEELKQFIADNYDDLHAKTGATKGQLKKDYKKIETMANRVKKDAFFMKTMAGKHQVIMTGELFGSKIKIKVDSLLDNAIVDLKSCESFSKTFYDQSIGKPVSFIEHWGYVRQGAIYQEIVRQNIGKTLPFFLSCVSKEEEPDIGVFQIDNESMSQELKDLEDVIPHIQSIKDGLVEPTSCGKCEWCRKNKVLTEPINWLDI